MTLQNFTLGTFAQGAAGGGAAFESIATVTLGSDTNSVTFNSIVGTYQHLQVRILARDTATGVGYHLKWRFNSDSGTNYPSHALQGDGASATAAGYTGLSYGTAVNLFTTASHTNNNFSAIIMDILDYSSSSKNKTVRVFGGYDNNGAASGGGGDGVIGLDSSVWLSTSAITSLVFTSDGVNYKSGSTFALYGIKGA